MRRSARIGLALAISASSAAGCGGDETAITGSGTSTTGGAGPGGAGSGGVEPPIDVGPISGNPKSKDEFETSVTVSPVGNTVATSWTEEPTGSGPFPIGYAFSTDGGMTWTPPAKVFSPLGSAADSVVGSDGQGNVTLVFLGHGGGSGIFAARAAGTVFGAPLEITDPAENGDYDKPWIARLASGSLLVTYQKDIAGAVSGVAATTTDGTSWTRTTIAADASYRNLFYPCVSPETGRVWVTFYTPAKIGLRWSDDGGTTWTPVDVTVSAPDENDIPFAEPECVASGDEVWVIYGRSHDLDSVDSGGKDPKLYAVRVAHSQGGAVIDSRVDAHDPAAATYFLHPQIARDAGGGIDVTYYTGQKNLDALGGFRRARSTDGGKTFAPSLEVHAPVTLVQTRSSTQWPGDYSGLATVGGDLFMTYIDNEGGAARVAFFRTDAAAK